MDDQLILQQTQRWLDVAVIGLNLCPFAKAVRAKQQIRFVVSQAQTTAQLSKALIDELQLLQAADPAQIDTTLLIHPHVLQDFLAYNDYLDRADALLDKLDLIGEIQIASFHPRYQFADSQADDITNYTNRSPYPMLHLLREASVQRAVEQYPDPDSIYQNNMQRLQQMGHAGWQALNLDRADDV